jgi:hypothetical protein
MVMGNHWNEAIELFRGVLMISLIIGLAVMFIPPQQPLNMLINVLTIAPAAVIALILIIKEYKKVGRSD